MVSTFASQLRIRREASEAGAEWLSKPHKKGKQAGDRSYKPWHYSGSLKGFKQRRGDKMYRNVKSKAVVLSLAFHPKETRALGEPVCTLSCSGCQVCSWCSLHPEALPLLCNLQRTPQIPQLLNEAMKLGCLVLWKAREHWYLGNLVLCPGSVISKITVGLA